MPNDLSFVAHCLELLGGLGTARSRPMFGGHGLTINGYFLALIADGQLYLKADATSRVNFAAAGSSPFTYKSKDGRAQVMAYWRAPDEALESSDQMRPWAQLAMDAVLRAATAKPASKSRKPKSKPSPMGKTS